MDKVKNNYKKINNILRGMSGRDWGASRTALLNIYRALRAAIAYGSIAYMSAAETNLKELHLEQHQALQICSGAFKTPSVAAIQVEMGEMPLRITRVKNMLAYWVNQKGLNKSHPTKQECWEHNKARCISFG